MTRTWHIGDTGQLADELVTVVNVWSPTHTHGEEITVRREDGRVQTIAPDHLRTIPKARSTTRRRER